jgi:hypothetical protein
VSRCVEVGETTLSMQQLQRLLLLLQLRDETLGRNGLPFSVMKIFLRKEREQLCQVPLSFGIEEMIVNYNL